MDKRSNNLEDFTRKMIKEAGVSKPSLDFSQRVMEAIEAKDKVKSVYTPLISRKIWMFIAAISIGCMVAFYFLPNYGTSILDTFGTNKTLSFDFTLPRIELSKTLIYAIGFMSLFLIQVPFLKQYVSSRIG